MTVPGSDDRRPLSEVIDIVDDSGPRHRRSAQDGVRPEDRNLLLQDTVAMTVFAQDPIVMDAAKGHVLAQIAVPADRLQRGPRGHRFHVVDIGVGTNAAGDPVALHDEDPWVYRDRWDAAHRPADPAVLVDDDGFRAQNVYAVAAHTLALFERHLGRPIPWYSRHPQLYLVPRARIEANAFYSREHNAVLFGWLPPVDGRPSLYTALSYDVIAHEVTHAILDGLRPRYTEPGLPDQLAFHEALADLVAMLSVFSLADVAQRLLPVNEAGKVVFESDAAAMRIVDEEARRQALANGRADELKSSPLFSLAEELGGRREAQHAPGSTVTGRYPALRRSVTMPVSTAWLTDPAYEEPHRRAEVLVAACMQTMVTIWAGRLDPLRDPSGLDAARVAEEGVKSAQHLLGMVLRALDYLPPVELEFSDVIDAVLTADKRLAADDEHGYRDALSTAFESFGIVPPPHQMVDRDGIAAPVAPVGEAVKARRRRPPYRVDPDAKASMGIRYEHLNLSALRTSPEEVYRFIWNNAGALHIDVRLTTHVERVLGSTRVGPDGLIVNEIIADYIQLLHALPGDLPRGIKTPVKLSEDKPVELLGGGVLVFDQFGRFRLHQRKPILDVDRQNRRLRYLLEQGILDRHGGLGTSDGQSDRRRFAMLHSDAGVDEL